MKYSLFSFIGVLVLLFSCGLKYIPTETRENADQNRKNAITRYITDSYKDSAVTYESLGYSQPTVIKPYQYKQLDSLYEVKYKNEQAGVFDKALETKINNQKNVLLNSTSKVAYLEHHIYSINAGDTSFVYFADINFGTSDSIKDFTITQTYQFPTIFLPTFKSYITKESILYPNYAPTNEEQQFYAFFEEELNKRPTMDKNKFMSNLLTVFFMARRIRSIDTKQLLQQLAVFATEKRDFNPQTDYFNGINGVWDGETLLKYEVTFTTVSGKYERVFSPYFEFISQ
jgi:hypothetical protein